METPYVQERWELVAYVNSTVVDSVAQPMARCSDVSGGLNDVYGLGRLSTSGGTAEAPVAATYLADGLGSVSAVLDGSGAVSASYAYSPWGEASGDAGELPAYGYNAEEATAAGLQYLRARWYDAGSASFASRDAYLGDAVDPASLNRYAYVQGNPVAYSDPTGRSAFSKITSRVRAVAKSPGVQKRVQASKRNARASVALGMSVGVLPLRSGRNALPRGSGGSGGRAAPVATRGGRSGVRYTRGKVVGNSARFSSRLGAYSSGSRRAQGATRSLCGGTQRIRGWQTEALQASPLDVIDAGVSVLGAFFPGVNIVGVPIGLAAALSSGDGVGAALTLGSVGGSAASAARGARALGRVAKSVGAARDAQKTSKAAKGASSASSTVPRRSPGPSGSTVRIGDITDGQRMTVSEALDLAVDYLGAGYKEDPRKPGRFVSADGLRVVRMTDGDITGKHSKGQPHLNFESMVSANRGGDGIADKLTVDANKHIFLTDED